MLLLSTSLSPLSFLSSFLAFFFGEALSPPFFVCFAAFLLAVFVCMKPRTEHFQLLALRSISTPQRQKVLEDNMKLKWNFQGGARGWRMCGGWLFGGNKIAML